MCMYMCINISIHTCPLKFPFSLAHIAWQQFYCILQRKKVYQLFNPNSKQKITKFLPRSNKQANKKPETVEKIT